MNRYTNYRLIHSLIIDLLISFVSVTSRYSQREWNVRQLPITLTVDGKSIFGFILNFHFFQTFFLLEIFEPQPRVSPDAGIPAIMSDITDDPSSDSIPLTTPPPLRKVSGVVIPSKTWVPFLAGAIGGMSGAVLTAPLDVVKTRLQSDFYKERLQAVKMVGTLATTRLGVWGHLVDTGAIIR